MSEASDLRREWAVVEAVGASEPWAFTQSAPLRDRDFCKGAKRWSVDIKVEHLVEAWRVGALLPIAEVVDTPVPRPAHTVYPEPRSGYNTVLFNLRSARHEGRLLDPRFLGFRPECEYGHWVEQWGHDRRWWNGWIYSRWQYLALDYWADLFTYSPDRQIRVAGIGFRELSEQERSTAEWWHDLAELLTAIEPWYLPTIQPPWVHLSGSDYDEWSTYRAAFAPDSVLQELGWTPDRADAAAQYLLKRASNRDPTPGPWQELIYRSSYRRWKDLRGDSLAALEMRIAGEMLLQVVEEIGFDRSSQAITDYTETLRIGHSTSSLDGAMSTLGIHPAPGVVLIVEGETEEYILGRLQERLRLSEHPGIVQSSVMRGTKAGLTKLVGFTAGPVVERKDGDEWLLARPPTYVLVTVDPDAPFDSPESIETERTRMLDEIMNVVRAQGVEPAPGSLDDLVQIETWSAACFEFEHFTDAELASALLAVHRDCGGQDRRSLERALRLTRTNRQDIKRVWRNWRPDVSKRELAKTLWPVLEQKIALLETDASTSVPALVLRVWEAQDRAAHRRAGRWVLEGTALPA